MTAPVPPLVVAPLGAGETALVERFVERATKLGAKVQRVATLDEVAALAAGLAATPAVDPAAGRAAIAPGLDEAQPALRRQLAARGLAIVQIDPADPAATFAGVSVGISEVLYGIAETGSAAIADPLPDRLVRMLSPKHVVILAAGAIVPGLDEAGERLRALVASGDARGAFVSFITGPSRTADIEMSLTVGAHGPAEIHIAILGAAQA